MQTQDAVVVLESTVPESAVMVEIVIQRFAEKVLIQRRLVKGSAQSRIESLPDNANDGALRRLLDSHLRIFLIP